MSSSDHNLLEKAIRRSVPNKVGSNHAELSAGARDVAIVHEHDLIMNPELHPVARQMPGTERALDYRDSLLNCLVDADPRNQRSFIEELLQASIPVPTLAVHLFAPVAARLGDLWCTDEADFMQVAVASTRLSMIVNHVSHLGINPPVDAKENRRVLLARTSGAMHTIGISIVASCFRDMGWTVDGGSDLEIGDSLYMRLSNRPYNLLGISVGRVDEVLECSEAIHRVQTSRPTRNMKIAVGGPAVIASPKAFNRIGADFVTRSALDVMQLASHV
ncbi:cobalamin-dependent protein [Ciceribacter sp. L1K22]|uniref:cobalamin B12-binding domain-containing protein n=1 Tax=Ciceribacter sp. L1K22 TaxID=2820275 RepID=UPI001FEFFB8E|nr:cobalamin-dependent protein [Ciceribacter sp. L1K22]